MISHSANMLVTLLTFYQLITQESTIIELIDTVDLIQIAFKVRSLFLKLSYLSGTVCNGRRLSRHVICFLLD